MKLQFCTKTITGLILLAATWPLAGCGDASEGVTLQQDKRLLGGTTTVFDQTSYAYMLPAPGLSAEEDELHLRGDLAFEAQFVTPPADLNPGLGPTFNNNSCNSCHIRNGRGMPRVGAGSLRSQLLVRVSLPDDQGEPPVPGSPVPVPGLGLQIQDHAVFGQEPEASVSLEWEEVEGTYGDGTPYSLRRPLLDVELADGGQLPAQVMTSLRQPPPVFGLGLLEAVAEETILEWADADDHDADGVSGRPNYVWSARRQQTVLGRFGLKANQPDLEQQSAAAYFDDMGVLNPLFAGEDGEIEIGQDILDAATFYSQSLGVPSRRDVDDPTVRRGERLFEESGCADCHRPTMHTGQADIPVLAEQVFRPYTDLLLHDMGPELADGRPDFEADGYEWRTPPLWGVGLVHTVLPGAGYLHDGRARTLAEAILWHGGEAESAKVRFRDELSKDERDALIRFLRSL